MITVTTFSQTGYNEYAKEHLESWKENWPGKIVAYTEAHHLLDGVEERPFFSIQGTVPFFQYIQNLPLAHGKTEKGYDYNKDAWKFTRKVFAQWDVLKDYEGIVYWLDADVKVRKPVPRSFLEEVFEDKPLVYLGREGFYTETGVIGFDTRKPKFKEFLDYYINCYRSGAIFTLPRWHDCQAFDWAREMSGIEGKNLTDYWKIPEGQEKVVMTLKELNVFNRSVFGEYLKHYKGNRKTKVGKPH